MQLDMPLIDSKRSKRIDAGFEAQLGGEKLTRVARWIFFHCGKYRDGDFRTHAPLGSLSL